MLNVSKSIICEYTIYDMWVFPKNLYENIRAIDFMYMQKIFKGVSNIVIND